MRLATKALTIATSVALAGAAIAVEAAEKQHLPSTEGYNTLMQSIDGFRTLNKKIRSSLHSGWLKRAFTNIETINEYYRKMGDTDPETRESYNNYGKIVNEKILEPLWALIPIIDGEGVDSTVNTDKYSMSGFNLLAKDTWIERVADRLKGLAAIRDSEEYRKEMTQLNDEIVVGLYAMNPVHDWTFHGDTEQLPHSESIGNLRANESIPMRISLLPRPKGSIAKDEETAKLMKALEDISVELQRWFYDGQKAYEYYRSAASTDNVKLPRSPLDYDPIHGVVPIMIGSVIALLIFIVVCYRKNDDTAIMDKTKGGENDENLTPAEQARRKQLSQVRQGSQEPLLPGKTKFAENPAEYEYDPANPDQPKVRDDAIYGRGASKEGQHNAENCDNSSVGIVDEEADGRYVTRKRSSVIDRA